MEKHRSGRGPMLRLYFAFDFLILALVAWSVAESTSVLARSVDEPDGPRTSTTPCPGDAADTYRALRDLDFMPLAEVLAFVGALEDRERVPLCTPTAPPRTPTQATTAVPTGTHPPSTATSIPPTSASTATLPPDTATPTSTPLPISTCVTAEGSISCDPRGYLCVVITITNNCGEELYVSDSTFLDAAPSENGPWTQISPSGYCCRRWPPGTSLVTTSWSTQHIPEQYSWARVRYTAHGDWGWLEEVTDPVEICRSVQTPTSTPIPASPTACAVTFSDVPPGHTFYPYIRCLACRGLVSGYADGTFRPGNNVTRGQLSKLVSNALGEGYPIPPPCETAWQTYEDVPPNHTFWLYIEKLSITGIIGGYPCSGEGEPCVPPENRPYFRPGADATRGQIAKIVVNAAGFTPNCSGQMFEDIPPGHTFYCYPDELAARGILTGYPCGGPGEPCGPENRPYFRPGNNATRGQVSKIVANTLFPGCDIP
jgi:hypothetical protein